MTSVLVLVTCFNRKDKTEACIRSMVNGNPNCRFSFVVVDDNSTDGTVEMLERLGGEVNIAVVRGTGGLFYSGGMRLAMQYAKQNSVDQAEYVLLVNDDVAWAQGCMEKLIAQSVRQHGAVIVGATQDDAGKQSYGAIQYIKGIKYRMLTTQEANENADTFNANCVLIPKDIFESTPIMDEKYVHSLGDFDYGLSINRRGGIIHTSEEYVGVCNRNSNVGTWTDPSLPIRQRIKLKESAKGAPTRLWFYFLKKNFGIFRAVMCSWTPYIRILLDHRM